MTPNQTLPPLAVIGQPLDRVDGRLKVTGEARYSAEIDVPGVLHAALVPSTIGKGKIRALDAGPAERAPGVVAVLSHLNAPRLARPTPRPAGESLPILQGPDILYYGQYVAVVVAATLEQAEYAATLVRPAYDAQPPTVALDAPGTETVRPPLRFGSTGPAMQTARGNPAQGLAEAAVRVEQTYTVPTEHHNPLEPLATLASWTGDELLVYETTQGVSDTRQVLAEVFGVPQAQVRVVTKFLGGGFGCKGNCWTSTLLAVLAARLVGRPVKLVLTRQQLFIANGHRTESRQQVALGATAAGRLTGIRHATRSHTSQLDNFVEPCGMLAQMLYSCPSVAVSHELVRLDVSTPTFARGPGEASGSFALESALDELAHALHLDPIELRNRNYAETDEQAQRPFSSKALRECLALGAAKFDWGRRRAQPRQVREGRWLVGYGVAVACYPANFMAATASASFAADGQVVVRCGTQDLGTGMYTIGTQLAADTLGLPVAQVHYEIGDTRLPAAPMSRGSSASASARSAVRAACLALRARLILLATQDAHAPLGGLTEKDIVVENGRMRARNDPARAETYAAALHRLGQHLVEATAGAAPGPERPEPGQPAEHAVAQPGQPAPPAIPAYSFHSFGAQFCEVRVDEEIGLLQVRRMLGVFGAGRILNPKTARSQIQGGMVWGLSMATHEESHRDPRYGHIVNADLAEYHVPVSLDVPALEVHFVDEPDEAVNPLGVKGVGELGIVGAAAAIANAIFNATGRRLRQLPITPDKLLQS